LFNRIKQIDSHTT